MIMIFYFNYRRLLDMATLKEEYFKITQRLPLKQVLGIRFNDSHNIETEVKKCGSVCSCRKS